MRNFLTAVFVVVLTTASASAQVTGDVVYVSAAELGDDSPAQVVGGYLIAPPDARFALVPAAVVTFDGLDPFPPGAVTIEAEAPNWDPVAIFELSVTPSRRSYLVFRPGRVRVQLEAFAVEPELRIERKRLLVEIGPGPEPEPEPEPGPGPEPEPEPDVAPDAFDNIGRRVATWAATLTDRATFGEAYAAAANELRTSPSDSIDTVQVRLIEKIRQSPESSDYSVKVGTPLSADLNERWPLTRGVLADYFEAVSRGLGQ